MGPWMGVVPVMFVGVGELVVEWMRVRCRDVHSVPAATSMSNYLGTTQVEKVKGQCLKVKGRVSRYVCEWGHAVQRG